MTIEQKINAAFGVSLESVISDEFIEKNVDLMSLEGNIDFLVFVPSYMLWCVKKKESAGNLVCDYTIGAISEFGRCKDPNIEHLSFKYLCNEKQKSVVVDFLCWALENLELCDEEQIRRALKHW